MAEAMDDSSNRWVDGDNASSIWRRLLVSAFEEYDRVARQREECEAWCVQIEERLRGGDMVEEMEVEEEVEEDEEEMAVDWWNLWQWVDAWDEELYVEPNEQAPAQEELWDIGALWDNFDDDDYEEDWDEEIMEASWNRPANRTPEQRQCRS